ncbi:MAG: hypothetical protein NT178_05240 [Proteobacteria bacterium]|nr:hypothetical protein [Pseudomonadota bacterium]
MPRKVLDGGEVSVFKSWVAMVWCTYTMTRHPELVNGRDIFQYNK